MRITSRKNSVHVMVTQKIFLLFLLCRICLIPKRGIAFGYTIALAFSFLSSKNGNTAVGSKPFP